ncbi:unannotated protein [freshwater metagenome]|uniref:Unannotated protein n=1 Tax=freshwater metagenome TaxID=449393 RepID=A0A6J6Z8F9_9ZZZZ
MTAQHGLRLDARGEEGVPLVRVDRRHVERFGVLGEGDRVAALGRKPPHLGRSFFDIEQRQHAARDEATGMRTAPLVDVPVVVGLDHDLVDIEVGALVQHLPGEAGEVGEVESRELTTRVHVTHALVYVEAARTHFVVAARVDVEHLAGFAGHGIEAEIATLDVAVPPLLDAALVGEDPRRLGLVTGRNMRVEHGGRFGDVIVDADEDEIVGLQRVLLVGSRRRLGGWITWRYATSTCDSA